MDIYHSVMDIRDLKYKYLTVIIPAIQLRLSIIQNYCIRKLLTELWLSIIFNSRSEVWMHETPKAIDYGYMINYEQPWFNCRYP